MASEQAEVKVINDRLTKIIQSLADLDESLGDYEKEKETLTIQIETFQVFIFVFTFILRKNLFYFRKKNTN